MATGAIAILCFRFEPDDKVPTRRFTLMLISHYCHRHQMVLTPDTIGSAVRVVNSMLV
jgi:hypothetical protein